MKMVNVHNLVGH